MVPLIPIEICPGPCFLELYSLWNLGLKVFPLFTVSACCFFLRHSWLRVFIPTLASESLFSLRPSVWPADGGDLHAGPPDAGVQGLAVGLQRPGPHRAAPRGYPDHSAVHKDGHCCFSLRIHSDFDHQSFNACLHFVLGCFLPVVMLKSEFLPVANLNTVKVHIRPYRLFHIFMKLNINSIFSPSNFKFVITRLAPPPPRLRGIGTMPKATLPREELNHLRQACMCSKL